MSGRFEDAPLVYVTAFIRTSTLPSLTKDQSAELEQCMVNADLVHHKVSTPTAYEFKIDASAKGAPEETKISRVDGERSRHGYFSRDLQEALIIRPNGFEWRTCKYRKYSNLKESFSHLIGEIIKIVTAFGKVTVEEVILSYADVIAPLADSRSLGDYFKRSEGILPLALFEDSADADLQQSGIAQINRIVSPKQKITITIEQLPTLNGALHKFLPDTMSEVDKEFGQPFNLKEDWAKERISRKSYALLLSQAAELKDVPLNSYSETDLFRSTHELTKEIFWSLINREVCDVDWKYVETEKTS